jgi:hypothetical protein
MNFDEVLREELDELGRRRAGERGAGPDEAEDARPASPDALVGLCFSGGGIRSATFNLGVVRGLHRWGLLRFVDYLSTVSGGGYIGSYVANLYRVGRELDVLASSAAGRRSEPPGVKHLRGLGRFLTPTGSLGEWLQAFAAIVRGILWNSAIFMLLAIALAAVFGFMLDAEGEWIFAFPHGLATGVAFGVIGLALMASVFGRRLPSPALLVTLLLGTALVAVMDALPWAVAYVLQRKPMLQVTALASGVAALAASGVLSKLPTRAYVLAARLLALLLVVLLPLALFLLFLGRFVASGDDPTTQAMQVGAIALLGVFVFVDFNRTSIHGFYAERIAATFLTTGAGGGEDPQQSAPPRLSEFRGQPGPLHLVNASLDVPGEADPRLRDRKADFFTLSCLHVGGPRTGYAAIEDFEAAKPDFTLANAVAISGAAAAPNMGRYTDALLRPIMTVLNVRLGYWAPNPMFVRDGSGWTPWLRYLFAEMRGDLRSDGKLVNLSDGGHLENLGAFELLRRKCKLIIIGDGEADPALSLGAMATLIRFAQVDLDADIDIDLDDLRIDERGISTKHAALGTVRYADGSVGRILYLKPSVTGHEAPDVRYYKDQNPDFPHETTADQWFDDDQFDAYRCLGEEVVDSLFQGLGYAAPGELELDEDGLAELLAALAVVLAPTSRSRSGKLTTQLDELQKALMVPEFADYRRQLVPTIHAQPIPDARLHQLAPIVMMQLQLMENAVEQLGLLDVRNREALANRGWLNEFRRWAQSEAFGRMALVCLPSFGANLSEFVEVALRLGTRYAWAEFPARERTLALVESTPEDARMVTGLAEYRVEDDETISVHRLVMRSGFGGRDRVEAAIAALRERYAGKPFRFVEAAAELTQELPVDAYLLRRHTREWTREDELAVLEFTRGRQGDGPPDDGEMSEGMMAFVPGTASQQAQ